MKPMNLSGYAIAKAVGATPICHQPDLPPHAGRERGNGVRAKFLQTAY